MPVNPKQRSGMLLQEAILSTTGDLRFPFVGVFRTGRFWRRRRWQRTAGPWEDLAIDTVVSRGIRKADFAHDTSHFAPYGPDAMAPTSMLKTHLVQPFQRRPC